MNYKKHLSQLRHLNKKNNKSYHYKPHGLKNKLRYFSIAKFIPVSYNEILNTRNFLSIPLSRLPKRSRSYYNRRIKKLNKILDTVKPGDKIYTKIGIFTIDEIQIYRTFYPFFREIRDINLKIKEKEFKTIYGKELISAGDDYRFDDFQIQKRKNVIPNKQFILNNLIANICSSCCEDINILNHTYQPSYLEFSINVLLNKETAFNEDLTYTKDFLQNFCKTHGQEKYYSLPIFDNQCYCSLVESLAGI